MKEGMMLFKKRIRKLTLKITLLFSSLLLFFILAELVSIYIHNSPSFIVKLNKDVRTTGADYFLSEDKELLYEGNYISNKYLNPINYERLLDKENNTFRILILGDSVAASFINGSNQYFSDKLEERLSETSDIQFQVVNAAVGGYNTIQEARYFETRGIKLKSDLVIVLFCTNDFDLLSGIAKEKDGTIRLISYPKNIPFLINSSFSRFFIKHSSFYRFLNEMSVNIAKRYTPGLKVYYYLLAEEKNKAALNKIIKLSKEKDVPLLIVIFPRLENFAKDYPQINLHDEVKNISQENSIHFLDLLGTFKEYDYRKLRLTPEDDTHPNKLGYDIAIDEIINYLKNEKLIPKKE